MMFQNTTMELIDSILSKIFQLKCSAISDRSSLSKKDCVEISTHLDVYKYFYTKCVAILHSCVEI